MIESDLAEATRVADVLAAIEAAYPPRLAEPWDTGIGLSVGDPAATVTTVLLAVDVDPATVAEASEVGAQLLVTHHPLLFRPVQTVARSTDKGALIHDLIRNGIAHISAHTNADRAMGGVNDALAETIGLRGATPLIPSADNPREGLGRVGLLPQPLTLAAFADHLASVLPRTAWGVRAAGDPRRLIRRVAVCGGAGGAELGAAGSAGADAYVTSDLTHHLAQEHISDPARPALIDIAHFAGEWPWLPRAAAMLAEAFPGRLTTRVSTLRTDAWSVHAAAPGIDS